MTSQKKVQDKTDHPTGNLLLEIVRGTDSKTHFLNLSQTVGDLVPLVKTSSNFVICTVNSPRIYFRNLDEPLENVLNGNESIGLTVERLRTFYPFETECNDVDIILPIFTLRDLQFSSKIPEFSFPSSSLHATPHKEFSRLNLGSNDNRVYQQDPQTPIVSLVASSSSQLTSPSSCGTRWICTGCFFENETDLLKDPRTTTICQSCKLWKYPSPNTSTISSSATSTAITESEEERDDDEDIEDKKEYGGTTSIQQEPSPQRPNYHQRLLLSQILRNDMATLSTALGALGESPTEPDFEDISNIRSGIQRQQKNRNRDNSDDNFSNQNNTDLDDNSSNKFRRSVSRMSSQFSSMPISPPLPPLQKSRTIRVDEGSWTCQSCNHVNPLRFRNCDQCFSRNPTFPIRNRTMDEDIELPSQEVDDGFLQPLHPKASPPFRPYLAPVDPLTSIDSHRSHGSLLSLASRSSRSPAKSTQPSPAYLSSSHYPATFPPPFSLSSSSSSIVSSSVPTTPEKRGEIEKKHIALRRFSLPSTFSRLHALKRGGGNSREEKRTSKEPQRKVKTTSKEQMEPMLTSSRRLFQGSMQSK